MAVYVDELVKWPHAKGRFKAGSCHLMADAIPELHAFAARIGVAKHWFHRVKRHPHYDLVEAERTEAVAAGAIEMSGLDLIRMRLEKQRAASSATSR